MRLKKISMVFSFIMILGSISQAFDYNPADFPEGWSLNNAVKDSVFRVIKDKKTWDPQKAIWLENTFVFVKGHLMSKQFEVSAQDEIEIGFYAKSAEEKEVFCTIYTYARTEKGGFSYNGGLKGFSGRAKKEWAQISGKITIPDKPQNYGKPVDAVIVVLASDTGAYFDNPSISHIRRSKFSDSRFADYESSGRAKFVRQDYAGAREAFKSALGFASSDDERKLILTHIEETDRTERIATTAIRAKTIFRKADNFMKQGKYAEARREYEAIQDASGMDYMKEISLCSIAKLYRMEKDYVNAHKTYGKYFKIPELTSYYHIYGLFEQAKAYLEQKDYVRARQIYSQVMKTAEAKEHHLFRARLFTGDSYRLEKKYSSARKIYEELFRQQETSPYPHEGYRLDIRSRLEGIDGLADGAVEKSERQKRIEWVNSPKYAIYVSLNGSDKNAGTKEKPFATIQRAREEVRKIKSKGMPQGGIAVYLRGGKYFINGTISFDKDDSGTDGSPVVYRSYPGEEARFIGGMQVTNFKLLSDPEILSKLPEEAQGKVWVSDLKEAGITDYGQILNRGGYSRPNPAALELFFNGRAMPLARWPNEGWVKVADITPSGEQRGRGEYQLGGFTYSGNRPERWAEEKDAWLNGYWYVPYSNTHAKIKSIDSAAKNIFLEPDTRWASSRYYSHLYSIQVTKNMPYYAYNLLTELDAPGEWYLDRNAGRLYVYPPDRIQNSEVIVSTLDAPLLKTKDASNIVLHGMTFEVTRRDAITMEGGRNNLLAKSVIRNTGQWAVKIGSGWEHKVIGCDIYDTGEGGISLNPDPVIGNYQITLGRRELIPARHTVENNHIYRFNRFDGGYKQAVSIDGIGQVISHNLMNDSPMQAIYFNANDHVIEFNEMHDVLHTGKELGAIYVYGEPWYMMSRGTVIRGNLFHHISSNSSPNYQQQCFGLVLDAINSGIVMENNIFYRVPKSILLPGPDNRIENNIFADADQAIQLNNMWTLFNNAKGEPIASRISLLAEERLKVVGYKQPPWSNRYPQLVNILYDKTPVGWAKGITVKRNINTSGRFMTFGGVRDNIDFENNITLENPLFIDSENMILDIRQGSPVYGLAGFEPLPEIKQIGVYNDELRASWPVNRPKEEIGKYYYTRPAWAASVSSGRIVNPPPVFNIPARKSSITIDGKLDRQEWGGLDVKNAMVLEDHHTGSRVKGAKSYAWLFYDRDYLYIGIRHDPDPYKNDMPPAMKNQVPSFEVAMESQQGAHSHGWWQYDMVTSGPVYSMDGNFRGEFKLNNLFGMPEEKAKSFTESVEYKADIQDEENRTWTSEIKIPISKIGINPEEVEKLAFNIGVSKRNGWFAWVPTGGSIWKIENAGFIKFDKK